MAIAQQLAGYTLGKADLLRKAMGKKKREVLDAEFVGFSEGMKANGYSEAADQDAVGHPGPVLRLRVQQGALRGVRAGVLLDGLPQGQLPGRVHGRAAHQSSATTRTSRRSTSTSAAGWASRCCRRTSTSRTPNFTPVGTDIRFGLSAIRNVGDNVVAAIVGDPRGARAGSPTSTTSSQGRPLSVCNKRVVESLIKAGAFDSLGHPRRAAASTCTSEAVDSFMTIKRNEAHGQFDLFALGDDADEGEGNSRLTVAGPEIEEWDKSDLLAYEREMLGLYVSDHPLFGVEHVLTAATDCTIGSCSPVEDRPDGVARHDRRPGHRGCSAR